MPAATQTSQRDVVTAPSPRVRASRPPALWENNPDGDRVKIMIPVSLGLHVILFGIVIVATLFAPRRPLPPPNYQVSLIAPILKGSPGGGAATPAIRPPEAGGTPVAVATSAKPVPTAPPVKDTMTLPGGKTKPESRTEARARAAREAALERAARAGAAKGSPSATPTLLAAANPQGTPGTASGTGTGNGGVEYGTWDGIPGSATYEQQIQAIVSAAWDPFGKDIDAKNPLQCRIRVVIGFDGAIETRSFEEESGNPSFDASANTALTKVGRFPPPPMELKQYLAHKGIPLRFDSRTKLAANH